MVLQHAHSFPRASSDTSGHHLDAARILAGAGAIAVNVAALLLLLMPAGLPNLARQVDIGTKIVPIARRVEPPVPPPPQQVDVVKPQTPVTRVPVKPDIVRPVVDPVVVDQGTFPADPMVATTIDTGPVDIAPTSGPVHGIQLEYAKAPSPPYPRDALMAGLQGTVLLRVLVDVNGHPLQVEVERSSGHRMLDEAARRFVLKRWSFQPARQAGRAVQAIGLVPIDFRLD